MSEEKTLSVQELRRIVRLLERIHHMAEESSRRGMMKDGQAYLVQQYHAIVATLAPGGYTAVVHDAANLTGVALVEIYDLDK